MLLEIKNLDVEFPTRRGTVEAARNVSLTVEPGEVLGLVGESGAGKSTIGNAIIGLLERPGRVTGGEIIFKGSDIRNLPPEKMRRIRGDQIGMIFQDPQTSLNPLLTIGEQLVETIQKSHGLREKEATAGLFNCWRASVSLRRRCVSRPIRTNSLAVCVSGS